MLHLGANIFIIVVARITDWGSDCHGFIFGKGGITEGVLAVGLLKDSSIVNCFGSKQTERTIFDDRGIVLRFEV